MSIRSLIFSLCNDWSQEFFFESQDHLLDLRNHSTLITKHNPN